MKIEESKFPGIEELRLLRNYKVLLTDKRAIGRNEWYALTAELFRQPEQVSEKVILKKMAYAYSWMPTIPKYDATKVDWNKLVWELKKFEAENNSENARSITKLMVDLVNNSITGSSKVLNFLYPAYFPIIDSRVSNSLKNLQNLTKNPIFGIFKSNRIDLEYYISYCEIVQKWAIQCNDGTTINQIENLLFRWNGGQQIPIKSR